MLQEYDKFPNWLIDVEEGKIYSKRYNKFNDYINKNGYNDISGKLVHRVIWECVNGEIPYGYDIHHIDGDKENNSIYNLEMIEHKEHISEHKQNMSEETKNKISYSHKGLLINYQKYSKAVYQIDKKTNDVLNTYPSVAEAARQTNFNASHISSCCRGERKTHKGFKWRYKDE